MLIIPDFFDIPSDWGLRESLFMAVLVTVVSDVLAFTPKLADPAMDCLAVLEAGTAGGPIEVRTPLILCRDFGVGVLGFLMIEGVPVRTGVVAPDDAAESCFVGDLVGDYR